MKVIFESMTNRVFLILITGVVLATALTLGLAIGERQRTIAQLRDYHAVERVAQFIQTLETIPANLRSPFLAGAASIGLRAELAHSTEVVDEHQSELAATLDERLPENHQVFSAPVRSGDCSGPRRPSQDRKASERRAQCEVILVTLHDGERLRLTISPSRPPPSIRFQPEFVGYSILFLLSIGILAALVARMTMRPLKQLAQAATALGNDIERPPLPERGAKEIRQAAAAFNAMQARIRHHIQQRAHILAAITHDLQTPLTRLRLRLEKVEDAELRGKLIEDMQAMQAMVREGLDLARSMNSAESLQPLNLDSLIDSVCADAEDAGQIVTVSGKTGLSLMARPMALRRCLTNLIDNAVKYGQAAHVTAGRRSDFAVIRIRDEGAGIPESELEKVFEPFYRLENSRSRQTGGSGLGLTIALNIAEQHGGTLRLSNHPQGGLEAVLTLPCQPDKAASA
jgi:signal transduction histidine kinase